MFVVKTKSVTKNAEIKWTLENFALEWSMESKGKSLQSPLFHADGDEEVQWRLLVFPYGEEGDDDEEEDCFTFRLKLVSLPESRPASITTQFTVTLHDELKQKSLNPKTCQQKEVFAKLTTQGFWRMGTQSEILDCESLSITCKLEYGIADTTETSVINKALPPIGAAHENFNLIGDLSHLFPNHASSDVCFVIGGQETRAHKLILSARSPVFAAMFSTEMKESTENRAEIRDISSDVFEALVRFIYTDQVEFTEIDTKDLLVAANRYMIPLLKARCEEQLSGSLSIENCAEMWMLADIHDAPFLKKATEIFFRSRFTEVLKTEGWKNLAQSRSDVAIGIFASFQQ